jgi:hypothetical protein
MVFPKLASIADESLLNKYEYLIYSIILACTKLTIENKYLLQNKSKPC